MNEGCFWTAGSGSPRKIGSKRGRRWSQCRRNNWSIRSTSAWRMSSTRSWSSIRSSWGVYRSWSIISLHRFWRRCSSTTGTSKSLLRKYLRREFRNNWRLKPCLRSKPTFTYLAYLAPQLPTLFMFRRLIKRLYVRKKQLLMRDIPFHKSLDDLL